MRVSPNAADDDEPPPLVCDSDDAGDFDDAASDDGPPSLLNDGSDDSSDYGTDDSPPPLVDDDDETSGASCSDGSIEGDTSDRDGGCHAARAPPWHSHARNDSHHPQRSKRFARLVDQGGRHVVLHVENTVGIDVRQLGRRKWKATDVDGLRGRG